MARMIEVKAHVDERGCLGVLDEGELPFAVRRIFFIHSVPGQSTRGGHAHMKTKLLLISLAGNCKVLVEGLESPTLFTLEDTGRCLFVDAGEWHLLSDFSEDSVLLALASEPYDSKDYLGCNPRS